MVKDFKVSLNTLVAPAYATYEEARGAQLLAAALGQPGNEITRGQIDVFLDTHTEVSARTRRAAKLLADEIVVQQLQQADHLAAGIRLAGEGKENLPVTGGVAGKAHAASLWLRSHVRGVFGPHTDADALIDLVVKGDVAGVRSFKAENGVDGLRDIVNRLGADGNAAIILAAFHGRTEVLELLLQAGATVTAVDPIMMGTALHAAAFAGHAEACEVLIRAGISLDEVGPHNGFTALHDAVRRGQTAVVNVLIRAGADRGIRSADGETALDMAKRLGYRDIVELLQA